MEYKELAKSVKDIFNPDPGQTLLGHTINDLNSLEKLYGTKQRQTQLFKDACKFFKLNDLSPEEIIRIFDLCNKSIIFHDLGKSNEGFRKMLLGDRESKQCIKHEFLSAYALFNWIDVGINYDDLIYMVSLISTHHLRFSDKTFCEPENPLGNGTVEMRVNGVNELVDLYCKKFNLTNPRISIKNCFNTNSDDFDESCENTLREMNKLHKKLKKDKKSHKIYKLCLCMIIHSDASGSRVIKDQDSIEWEHECFSKKKISSEYIHQYIISPKKLEIEKHTGKSFKYEKIQEDARNFSSRCCAIAECAGGKTIMAYEWAASQVKENPKRSLIFLYPTRDTATSGYKSYLMDIPDLESALLHSSKDYEIEKIYNCPDENGNIKEHIYNIYEKLYTMNNWFKNVFCSTIDQFLGFMHNKYNSTLLLPCLYDSLVIIDEIHSMDNKSFSTIIKFLDNFDVPVLCMTATLDNNRISQLKEKGMEIYEDHKKNILIKNNDEKKYIINLIDEIDIESYYKEELKENNKIVFYNNQIKHCQESFLSLGVGHDNSFCYHALFRTGDRQKIRDDVLNSSNSEESKLYLFCTQVAEMSLDLLYVTSMFTPLTRIDSFIQRLGRLMRTRKGEKIHNKDYGNIFVFTPPNNSFFPYEKKDIDTCKRFINDLMSIGRIGQNDLINTFRKYDNDNIVYNSYNSFLESGIYANKNDSNFREDQDHRVSSILNRDIDEYKNKKFNKKPIDGLLAPCPRKYVSEDKKVDKFIYVIDDDLYNEKIGIYKEDEN